MKTTTLPQLQPAITVAEVLAEAAALVARSTQRQLHRALRPRVGQTLRPGTDTPLWNELAKAVKQHLTRRGDRARMARFLGLPRQRINDFLGSRRALPDAERTLLLLHWLAAKQKGVDLA